MPDSLIVIRSGATDYELQGRIRGGVDIPLASAGIAEVERTIPLLAAAAPAALYCSRSSCAAETARLIGDAIGLAPRMVGDLGNLDQGLWQGMLVEDICRKQPRVARQWQDNPWSVVPPEGELLEEACDRVERTLQRIFRKHVAGRVAVVVPGLAFPEIAQRLGGGRRGPGRTRAGGGFRRSPGADLRDTLRPSGLDSSFP